MRTSFKHLIMTCGAAALGLWGLAAQAADESPTVVAILERAARSPQLSPALEEIVKLSKAGVADSVTLAYIQSSPTPYSLNAQDILRLHELGVSAQVVTALMQHNDELRRTTVETSNQAPTAATAPVIESAAPVATAPVTAAAMVVAPGIPTSSVSVTYFGFPDYSPCYYPRYHGFGVGYPYYAYAPRYYGYNYCGPRVVYYDGFGRCR